MRNTDRAAHPHHMRKRVAAARGASRRKKHTKRIAFSIRQMLPDALHHECRNTVIEKFRFKLSPDTILNNITKQHS